MDMKLYQYDLVPWPLVPGIEKCEVNIAIIYKKKLVNKLAYFVIHRLILTDRLGISWSFSGSD